MDRREVAIVGTGLIGGSLGLALKASPADLHIAGHDRDLSIAREAKKRGAVDVAAWNLVSAVESAEVVFVATPLRGVREVLQKAGPHMRSGAVVSDTATAKSVVQGWADKYLPEDVHYVGGNPIVHEEGAGIENARADLFRGITYCVVPRPEGDSESVELVSGLVRTAGAEPFFLDAAEHDGQMALVEHLPWVVAATLFRLASDSPAWRDTARLATGTFRRATRFPVPEPDIYRELCLANAENLARSVDLLIEELRKTRGLLMDADGGGLKELFAESTSRRSERLAEAAADQEALSSSLEEARVVGSLGRVVGLRRPRDRRRGKEG
ncbi:MAG: prephenate dehydrogenase [Anaerolineae bacterium]